MTVSISTIVRFTGASFGVSEVDLMSRRRDQRAVTARQVAMFLAREITHRSYPAIARQFDDRDHTTVMHACSRIAERVRHEPELAEMVESIRAGMQTPAEAA